MPEMKEEGIKMTDDAGFSIDDDVIEHPFSDDLGGDEHGLDGYGYHRQGGAADGGRPANGKKVGSAQDFVNYWLELSEIQRRTLVALSGELGVVSNLVETSVGELSGHFQGLAADVGNQISHTQSVMASAGSLNINGEQILMSDMAGVLEKNQDQMIAKVANVAKDSMQLVYGFEDVAKDMKKMGRSLDELEVINQKTNYLAINAKIEASAAGVSGKGFSVVADEVRELSRSVERTMERLRRDIDGISSTLKVQYETLKNIATMDMTDVITNRDRITQMMDAMMSMNDDFNGALAEQATASGKVSDGISSVVTSLQFQDRTKQRIENINDTHSVLVDAIKALQTDTRAEVDCPMSGEEIDQEWVNNIIGGLTLGEMRQRFVTSMLVDGTIPVDDTDDDIGPGDDIDDVELF